MSFIYAEKYNENGLNNESVRILCDTKTTLTNYSSANFSSIARNLISQYGIIKSTICCPELCVSFAGNNTVFATKLFKQLFDMRHFELEDVSGYALNLHRNAPDVNDIEFIITYVSNGQIHIDCVKNGELTKDLCFAHIGSNAAFNEFQQKRLHPNKNASDQTEHAFYEIVEGCSDDTVGGFSVKVIFDFQSNSFVYQWRRHFITGRDQIVEPGKSIRFDTSPSDGNYSYEIEPIDIENVLFKIDQMKPDILFSRKFRLDPADTNNKNLFGLMMPMLVATNDAGEIVRYM